MSKKELWVHPEPCPICEAFKKQDAAKKPLKKPQTEKPKTYHLDTVQWPR